MTDFSYSEVSGEYERLGYSYPSASDFHVWEVEREMGKVRESNPVAEVATLTGDSFPPAVLEAFAKLARTLSADIGKTYNGLRITREVTEEELRASAVDLLASKRNAEQREAARQSLDAKLIRDPAGESFPEIRAYLARTEASA